MSEGSVLVTYLHPNTVCHNFMDSLWRLWEHDQKGSKFLANRFAVRSGPNLDGSRNAQARVFLEQTECEWLWIVDSDMGFKPNALDRLMSVADAEARPVIGGLYYGFMETDTDNMGGWNQYTFPVAYTGNKEKYQYAELDGLLPGSVVEVDAVGTGCMLVHRSVFQRLRKDWFSFVYSSKGVRLGEDLSFCHKVRAKLKLPIYLDTGSSFSHQKTVWLRDDLI